MAKVFLRCWLNLLPDEPTPIFVSKNSATQVVYFLVPGSGFIRRLRHVQALPDSGLPGSDVACTQWCKVSWTTLVAF